MNDEVRARAYVENARGMFVVKCDAPGRSSLYLQLIGDRYLVGAKGKPVERDFEWRFDRHEPELAQWSYEGMQVFSSDESVVGHFLSRLRSAQRLVLRARDGLGGNQDWSFDVAGADAAIARVAKTCRAQVIDYND